MALLFNFLTILNYANSALNPLLYAFLSVTFRRNFAQLFRCQRFIPVLATAVTSWLDEHEGMRRNAKECEEDEDEVYNAYSIAKIIILLLVLLLWIYSFK